MEKEKLQQLLDDGKSIREIAKIYNKGYSTVRHWMKKYDLKSKNEQFHKIYFTEEDLEIKRLRHNKKTTEVNRRRAFKRKAELIEEMFDGGCVCCGYNRCITALEFHHLNPKNKSFGLDVAKIGQINYDSFKEEAEKCVILCSNCHREVHQELIDLKMVVEKLKIKSKHHLDFLNESLPM